jgi:hypothetical protein
MILAQILNLEKRTAHAFKARTGNSLNNEPVEWSRLRNGLRGNRSLRTAFLSKITDCACVFNNINLRNDFWRSLFSNFTE